MVGILDIILANQISDRGNPSYDPLGADGFPVLSGRHEAQLCQSLMSEIFELIAVVV